MVESAPIKLATIPESDVSGPPQVISVGLWRMGTASMAVAYNILGLRPHHALDMSDPEQWKLFEAAADGTWPDPKTGKKKRPPFTRAEWDQIYGKYGAITEMGSAFAEQLIAAYPEAKVVICRRDFDKWWPSFRNGIVVHLNSVKLRVVINLASLVMGRRGGHAMVKMVQGFFRSYSMDEFDTNAEAVYDEYFKRIDELVPPERKLVYQLGERWEPLCEFLDKPVPGVEFPRINEAVALRENQQQAMNKVLNETWRALKPWVVGLIGGGVAAGCVWFVDPRIISSSPGSILSMLNAKA